MNKNHMEKWFHAVFDSVFVKTSAKHKLLFGLLLFLFLNFQCFHLGSKNITTGGLKYTYLTLILHPRDEQVRYCWL